MELTKENLLDMYRQMVTIRFFEQNLMHYAGEGHVPGTGHVSIGEEAIAVGACRALAPQDYIISTHRAHGHLIARGTHIPTMLAEVFGKATGCTGGKGGSMHLSDFDRNILGTNGIVGGGINIAGGVGLTIKMKKTDQVSVCFFGDGASNRGVFHEGFNLASLWKIPVVYICTNNQYAMTLPLCKNCANQDISARAAAYDMPGLRVDGTDVIAVYETVSGALERARQGGGPSLIEIIAFRLQGHSMRMDAMPGGSSYRPEGEIADWWDNKDPIKIFREKLYGLGYMDEAVTATLEAAAKKDIDEATKFALDSPEPKPESIYEWIYA